MIGLETMWNSPHKGMPLFLFFFFYFFFFFFFFFSDYLVFTGKPPTIRLTMTGNRPHKGTPGMIIAIVPYIFFFFLNTYCLLTGKLPTFGLMMTWNCPHKGMPGTIITIVPFFLFFFLNTYSFYRKTAHVRARNDMELSPQRYAGHDHNNCALFPFFFFLSTYCFLQ